jgi:hypothetical protein
MFHIGRNQEAEIMRITPKIAGRVLIAALILNTAGFNTAAYAVDDTTPPPPPPATVQNAPAPSVTDAPISDSDLTQISVGQPMVIGAQTLSALSQGNSIVGDYTAGDVTLSDNALSGFNGIGNVVINTGAQSSLQAGMNLIVNVTP